MKKFIYSFLALFFVSTQSVFAAGYIATYSFNVSNPSEYVKALDELMDSDWGKSFPAVVNLHQYVFNGYDDATHIVVLNYEDAESLGKGTESFADPIFQAHLAQTASLIEPVEQSLNMITRQVDDIHHLVDEFSSFARMPSPKLKVININKVIAEYINPMMSSFEKVLIEVDDVIENALIIG